MFSVQILDNAKKDLSKIDRNTALRIIEKIKWLCENVLLFNHEKLEGNLSNLCKLRVGAYRILYQVIHSEKKIIIHLIGKRSEIYKSK